MVIAGRYTLLLLTVQLLIAAVSGASAAPEWWAARGVLLTNAAASDYSVANLGQLKWMATNAYDEMNGKLAGGAGTNIALLVKSFCPSNNNSVANIGQMKYVAAFFYDRLVALGMATNYPWTQTTTDDCDFAAANIGQLKHLFSFDVPYDPDGDIDGDGLHNGFETGTGCYVGPNDTGTSPTDGDSDDDTIGDMDEVLARTDPNNPDVDAPTVTVTYPENMWYQLLVP